MTSIVLIGICFVAIWLIRLTKLAPIGYKLLTFLNGLEPVISSYAITPKAKKSSRLINILSQYAGAKPSSINDSKSAITVR